MQDSLELPQQLDSVHTLLSPPQIRQSRENTPPHSLAYSNSTCAKDRMQEIQVRSPLMFDQLQGDSPSKFGIIKTNNQNYPINLQKTVPVSPNKKQEIFQNPKTSGDKAANKGQYKKIKPKVSREYKSPQKSEHISPNLKDLNEKKSFNATQPVQSTSVQKIQQRKTLDKAEHNKTNKRIKQLEQALHMQTILSEQLRTKLSITNSLLESKLKENDQGYFFSLKNSSRDMKNIDIYIQLINTRKTLNQKNIMIDRLKDQLKESNLQIQIKKLKLKKSGSPVVRSPNRTLNDQIEKLIDQKQSLMSYIDEQKFTLKKKIEYIAQLEQEVNRINDKSAHYTDIERPKLINQLSELKLKNRQLQELTETMRMQFNLQQLKIYSQNQQLKTKIEKLQQNLLKKQVILLSIEQKQKQIIQKQSIDVQKEDIQYKIMLEELILLKKQRDYYHNQYQKRIEDSARLYALQLKLSMMQLTLPSP